MAGGWVWRWVQKTRCRPLCCPGVLVYESAESVSSVDGVLVLALERRHLLGGFGRWQVERSERALAVVVVDVLAQEAFEVAPAHDQQRVDEAPGPKGSRSSGRR
jgi:hypothetical protein